MKYKGLIYDLIISCVFLSFTTQAYIVTSSNGVKRTGDIGTISEKGFIFYKDNKPFYQKFTDTVNIEIETEATVSEKEKQKETVLQITKMLDKDNYIKKLLIKDINTWLETQNYDALESKINTFNQQQLRMPSGQWMSKHFYLALTDDIDNRDVSALNFRLKQIKDWIKARPNSITAKISQLAILKELAWAYRGSGYSSTVTNKAREKFKNTLRKVIKIARSLKEQNVQDLMVYFYLIIAENAVGSDKSVIKNLSLESSQINPSFNPPYLTTLIGILPKWGGEYGEVEAFSEILDEKFSSLSPETTYIIHRELKKHIEDRQYNSMNFNWRRIQSSFDFFCKKI